MPIPSRQVVYYAFMDDAVNNYLIERGIGRPYPRYVVDSSCRYLSPLAYPDPVDVGLVITKLGTSSVVYSVGLFAPEAQQAAALGTFVHCYVDEKTGRPRPLEAGVRNVLAALMAPT
jgi:acyl-CoA thioester hydrolase